MSNGWEVEYVRRVLERTGWSPSALAKRAGFAASTITRALNSSDHHFRLSTTTLERIKAVSGMDYRGRAEKAETPTEELVPVYDFGPSAGQDAPHGDAIASCNIAFSQAFLRQMTAAKASDLAIVRVKGSSMEPTLMDGDMALVDFTKVNLSLDGLFVLRFDDELHVKRIGRSATRGNVMVISDHPSYPALDMSAPDLSVIGCVLWVGRKI